MSSKLNTALDFRLCAGKFYYNRKCEVLKRTGAFKILKCETVKVQKDGNIKSETDSKSAFQRSL